MLRPLQGKELSCLGIVLVKAAASEWHRNLATGLSCKVRRVEIDGFSPPRKFSTRGSGGETPNSAPVPPQTLLNLDGPCVLIHFASALMLLETKLKVEGSARVLPFIASIIESSD